MNVEILGAFLAGVGSILSAGWALRRLHRLEQEECEKRIQAFRNGLKEGRRK